MLFHQTNMTGFICYRLVEQTLDNISPRSIIMSTKYKLVPVVGNNFLSVLLQVPGLLSEHSSINLLKMS